MVAMDLEELLLQDRGVRPNVHTPHFIVIDEGHYLFNLRDKYGMPINPCSLNPLVDAYLCAELGCGCLSYILRDDMSICERGHVSDPQFESRIRERSKNCDITSLGLTRTDQGRLGEMAAFAFTGELREYGQIVEIDKAYNSPLDCLTTKRRGGEVRSMTTRTKLPRFDPGLPKYRRSKWESIQEQGLEGGLGIFVLLDLDDPAGPKAYIYVEPMDDGWRIFYPKKSNFVGTVDLAPILKKFIEKYKIKPRCETIDPDIAAELIADPEGFDVDRLIDEILSSSSSLAAVTSTDFTDF